MAVRLYQLAAVKVSLDLIYDLNTSFILIGRLKDIMDRRAAMAVRVSLTTYSSWAFNVNIVSRITPRYFAVSFHGISYPLSFNLEIFPCLFFLVRRPEISMCCL